MSEESVAVAFRKQGEKTVAVLEALRFDQPTPAQAGFEAFERMLRRLFNWEEDSALPAASALSELWRSKERALKSEHAALLVLVDSTKRAISDGEAGVAEKRRRRLAETLRTHLVRDRQELLEPLEALLGPEKVVSLREAWATAFP